MDNAEREVVTQAAARQELIHSLVFRAGLPLVVAIVNALLLFRFISTH